MAECDYYARWSERHRGRIETAQRVQIGQEQQVRCKRDDAEVENQISSPEPTNLASGGDAFGQLVRSIEVT